MKKPFPRLERGKTRAGRQAGTGTGRQAQAGRSRDTCACGLHTVWIAIYWNGRMFQLGARLSNFVTETHTRFELTA